MKNIAICRKDFSIGEGQNTKRFHKGEKVYYENKNGVVEFSLFEEKSLMFVAFYNISWNSFRHLFETVEHRNLLKHYIPIENIMIRKNYSSIDLKSPVVLNVDLEEESLLTYSYNKSGTSLLLSFKEKIGEQEVVVNHGFSTGKELAAFLGLGDDAQDIKLVIKLVDDRTGRICAKEDVRGITHHIDTHIVGIYYYTSRNDTDIFCDL